MTPNNSFANFVISEAPIYPKWVLELVHIRL
jgi:hypothetical protein